MLKQRMSELLQGKISLRELEDLVEDRLFELRQSPTMSEEQAFLSNLELLIHESIEGLRSKDELYEVIRFAILPELTNTIHFSVSVGSSIHVYTAISPISEYQCQQVVPV